MKGYIFEGELGKEIKEIDIPSNLQEKAQKLHDELIEKIVENDEGAMEAYLSGKEIKIEKLKEVLRKAVIANDIIPVFCGSALKNTGVQLVLDAVIDYLPSPIDVPPIVGTDPKTDEKITRKAEDSEPFSALAFKLQTDPFVGQLTYFRVYSGSLEAGSYIYNSTTEDKERVGRILRMHANDRDDGF